MVSLLILVAAVATRVAWHRKPGRLLCGVTYTLVLSWLIGMLINTSSLWYAVLLCGVLLNATVILANGGYMPVSSDIPSHSIWKQSTPITRLRVLGDNYHTPFAIFSIGDFILFAGAGGKIASLLWGTLLP